ncbi:MAG: hypothetical protein GC152_01645 [Alphaproteobacteria bacterium]|nr:hypothetical protein [Alphaproteobacteria bacterium]
MKVLVAISSILKRKAAPKADAAGDNPAQSTSRSADKLHQELLKDAQRNAHKRRDERQELSAIAELSIPDKGFSIDGVISEASRGGLTFRPATSYIIARDGERVQVIADLIKRTGIIRSTRVNGYGVQLLEPLSNADLAKLRDASVDLSMATFENDAA